MCAVTYRRVFWCIYLMHSYVCHDAYMCVPSIYVWWVHVCARDAYCVCPVYRFDEFMCVPWHMHVWSMTHLYVCQDSFICVTWLFQMCAVTQLCVCWESSMRVTANEPGVFGIYVCLWVCTCVCVFACMYESWHGVLIDTCMHVCMCVYDNVYVYVCMHIWCTQVYVCTLHAYVYEHMLCIYVLCIYMLCIYM